MTNNFSDELEKDIQAIEGVLKNRREWLDSILKNKPELLQDPRNLVEQARKDGILVYQDQIDIEEIYRSFETLRSGSQKLSDTQKELQTANDQLAQQRGDVESKLREQVEQDAPVRRLLNEIDQKFVELADDKTEPDQWEGILSQIRAKMKELEEKTNKQSSPSGNQPQAAHVSSIPSAYKAAIQMRYDFWQQRQRQAKAIQTLFDKFDAEIPKVNPEMWLSTLWLLHRTSDPYVMGKYRKEFYSRFKLIVESVEAKNKTFNAAIYQNETITGTPMPMVEQAVDVRTRQLPWIGIAAGIIGLIIAVLGVVFLGGQLGSLQTLISSTQTQIAMVPDATEQAVVATSTLITPTLTPSKTLTPTITTTLTASETPDTAATAQESTKAAFVGALMTSNASTATQAAQVALITNTVPPTVNADGIQQATMTAVQKATDDANAILNLARTAVSQAFAATLTAQPVATSTALLLPTATPPTMTVPVPATAKPLPPTNTSSPQPQPSDTLVPAVTPTSPIVPIDTSSQTATAASIQTAIAAQFNNLATVVAYIPQTATAFAANPPIEKTPDINVENTPELTETSMPPPSILGNINGANLRSSPTFPKDNSNIINDRPTNNIVQIECKTTIGDSTNGSSLWYKVGFSIDVATNSGATSERKEGYIHSSVITIPDSSALDTLPDCP